MIDKTTPSNNSSLFILIIPLAFISIILIKTWKVILSIIFLGVGWRVWQQYEWQQFRQQIDPYFKNLMQDKRGILTVLDLAKTAQIPNSLASKYLLSKARQYGAELLSYGDDRDTYYFLTAGVIQGILADSEPDTISQKFVPPSPAELAGFLKDKQPGSPLPHSLSTSSTINIPTATKVEPAPQTANSASALQESPSERGSIDYFPDPTT